MRKKIVSVMWLQSNFSLVDLLVILARVAADEAEGGGDKGRSRLGLPDLGLAGVEAE
jgi:hypothetical protein